MACCIMMRVPQFQRERLYPRVERERPQAEREPQRRAEPVQSELSGSRRAQRVYNNVSEASGISEAFVLREAIQPPKTFPMLTSGVAIA